MMDKALRKEILDFLTLLPCMRTEEARQAALYATGLDEIGHRTNLSGSPGDTTAAIVYALERYGMVDDKPALVVFLSYVATTVGSDKQEQIQKWCERLIDNALPASAPAVPDKQWDVFVCYAKEDLECARTLYAELRKAGVTPWMAYEDILPGQDWEYEITQALTRSRYVLALLSSNSVSRHGFIQKELTHALDVVNDLPPSSIFLIPARLDKCEPLETRLQRLHWVDLFPDYNEGLRRILRVLKPEAKSGSRSDMTGDAAVRKKSVAILKPNRKPKLQPPISETDSIVTLRSEPTTVSEDDFRNAFGLAERRRPLEYIANHYEDRGEVVMDHTTGLMWQKSGSENYLSYKRAQKYIKQLNTAKFAGFDDWRLPTIPELMSLLEPEKQSNGFFINTVFDMPKKYPWYWSADMRTKGDGLPGSAWYVNFPDGHVSWNHLGNDGYARAVRSC